MSLRKVQTIVNLDHLGFAVLIYRDSEWNEFRARLVRDGVADKESDAFADTKDEAIRTGHAMIVQAARQRDTALVIEYCTLTNPTPAARNAMYSAIKISDVDRSRMPATVCWIDGLCARSIVSESAQRFGIVTILPTTYFV